MKLQWCRLVILVWVALVVTACVTINVPRVNPGSYPNFREMAVAQMELMPWGNAPKDLIRRFNVCAVDVMLGYYTAHEIERLDKYARGEVHMSDSELKEIEESVEDRMGGEEELIGKMRQRCPEVLQDAEKHKQSS